MKVSKLLVAAALAASAAPSFAQQPMVVAPATDNVLHAGTSIQLETREDLTTEGKMLKVGRQFAMDVLQPVMINNLVAIPAGSRAVGEVTSVRNKGMWGKSGGITARVLYVEANGRHITLSGTFDDKGTTGTVGVIAAVAFVPIAGFFVTGTSAKIPTGTHVTAFVGEEVAVQAGPSGPSGAPAAVATVQPVAVDK